MKNTSVDRTLRRLRLAHIKATAEMGQVVGQERSQILGRKQPKGWGHVEGRWSALVALVRWNQRRLMKEARTK